MNDRYWDQFLYALIKMHDYGCATYQEFMEIVHEQWFDRCIAHDHARIVSRLI